MADCVVCTRPVSDTGLVCWPCTDRLAQRLRDAAGLWPAILDQVARLTRAGDPTPRRGRLAPAERADPPGHGSDTACQTPGWPSGLPVDLAAAEDRDTIRSTLSTWARVVAAERGVVPPPSTPSLMRWLAGHLPWLRHRGFAGEVWDELDAALRLLVRTVDRRAGRRYLGQCLEDGCPGDLYARVGVETAVCGTCGARHDVQARRMALEPLVQAHAYTAAEITAAYPDVREDRIRQWVHRGRLAVHARDRQGRALFLLGEVLELAERTRRKAAA